MYQIYVEEIGIRPKYDAASDRKLTGAIRGLPGFDNEMGVRKTRLLLQKRLLTMDNSAPERSRCLAR